MCSPSSCSRVRSLAIFWCDTSTTLQLPLRLRSGMLSVEEAEDGWRPPLLGVVAIAVAVAVAVVAMVLDKGREGLRVRVGGCVSVDGCVEARGWVRWMHVNVLTNICRGDGRLSHVVSSGAGGGK